MSYQASDSWMIGVKARLYEGGGEDVDHSSVRPFQGSPVVSRSASRRRKLTQSWMRKHAMPPAISTAPKAATTNQAWKVWSGKWLSRRVTPFRPRTYNGMKAT